MCNQLIEPVLIALKPKWSGQEKNLKKLPGPTFYNLGRKLNFFLAQKFFFFYLTLGWAGPSLLSCGLEWA